MKACQDQGVCGKRYGSYLFYVALAQFLDMAGTYSKTRQGYLRNHQLFQAAWPLPKQK